MMAREIHASALTTFDIAPDGAKVRLHVRDGAGLPATLVLPTDCLSQLLMTLPRMVQAALRASHGDASLRLVHPLAGFRFEAGEADAAGRQQFILTLETGDGFSVAFCAPEPLLASVAQSISDDIPAQLLTRGRPARLS